MYTERLLRLASDLDCLNLAKIVLENPKFSIWSGSSKPTKHHYGKGRLAEHTCEVVELALQNNGYFHKINKGVDSKKLFLACLYHDAGKMWDYEPVDETYAEWRGGIHKDKIYHVSRSAIVWCEAAKSQGWDEADIDEVLHCILSHHGRREWGSPVEPQSRMAWILHLCDGLSARVDDCDKKEIKDVR